MHRPDSMRSWAVSGACCFINCLLYGVARLSGLLMVATVDAFQVSRAKAAMPFSVSTSVRNLSGVFVGHLGQQFGIRAIVCLGCVMASLGAGLCFFAQDVSWITLCWGGLFGAGYGLATCLLPLAINQNFVRHCGSASGLSYSGSYIGSFIFPPLFVVLLDNYGLPGTFLIISGAVLNVLAASMFLGGGQKAKGFLGGACCRVETAEKEPVIRILYDMNITRNSLQPPPLTTPALRKQPLSTGKCKAKHHSDVGKMKKILLALRHGKKSAIDLPNMQVDNIRLTSFKKLHCILCPCAHRPRSQLKLNNNESLNKTDSLCSCESPAPKPPSGMRSSKERQLSNNEVRDPKENPLFGLCSCRSPAPKRTLSFKKRSLRLSSFSPFRLEGKKKMRTRSPSFLKGPRTLFSDWLCLLGRPMFLVISLTMSLYTFVIVCVITVIEDFAKDLLIPPGDVHYVLMALSTADLVGTLTLGFVTDKGLLSRRHFISLCFMGMGLCAGAFSLCRSYGALLCCVGCYGLFESGVVITFPLLVGEFVPLGKQAVAIASSNVFSAPTVLLVPIVIGHFRDHIGCYFGVFYLLGVTSLACSLLWILAPFICRGNREGSQKRITGAIAEST